MKQLFTPDEQLVIDFLKTRARSTAHEISLHTGLKKRNLVEKVLESLDAKGVLRHTDDKETRYYLIHTR
jgi:sugar-specific transcriptional regulator TrmB